ncbi:DUF4190 domain-containing protein [Mycolicibacterium mengxianglii]|uniref:DUF4190 domain-containing protein n=1 Tax=Mycolicibacterium mengxianglii TaxID=2736649 RepID=UPI0018D1193C|nr:DUF4190 domain-containing protein [Mycolicibacterium mengxianglii]
MTQPGGDSGDMPRDQTGEDQSAPSPEAPPMEQTPLAYEHPPTSPYLPGQPGPGASGPPPQYGPASGQGYGQPYPGEAYPTPDPYGYGYPQPRQSTNTMAIASLVISILGIVPFCGGILSIVGIVLGAVALSQIKETRQKGYGVAVAGIVVGVAMLVVGLIWTIFALR